MTSRVVSVLPSALRQTIGGDEFTDQDRPAITQLWIEMAELVTRETGLLPHLNPGVLTPEDYAALRPVAPSMGIMLESAASRLCERGMPHFGSPDKTPEARLATIAAAGEVGSLNVQLARLERDGGAQLDAHLHPQSSRLIPLTQ